jgi:hypothetical protein
MNGADVKLASFKGKVILLNFWAHGAAPARPRSRRSSSCSTSTRDDSWSWASRWTTPVEKMKPYAAQYKINYPLLVGNGREDVQEAFGRSSASGVGHHRPRRQDRKKHSGIATKSQFEREIKALLGAPPAFRPRRAR